MDIAQRQIDKILVIFLDNNWMRNLFFKRLSCFAEQSKLIA